MTAANGDGAPGEPAGGQPDADVTAPGEPGGHAASAESPRPEAAAVEAGVAEEYFAEQAGVPASAAGAETAADDATAAMARERDDFRDALQRLQADFENYKKRVAKQQDDLRERAAESLVEKLLPVLDTADLAMTHGGSEDVKQIAVALSAVLEREGLERIDNTGEAFDPNLHDAVAHEPGDGDGAQEVAEVMRAGYRWRGRVLRPAMVKVKG